MGGGESTSSREGYEAVGAVEMKRRSGSLFFPVFTTELSALSQARTQICTDYNSIVKHEVTGDMTFKKGEKQQKDREVHSFHPLIISSIISFSPSTNKTHPEY